MQRTISILLAFLLLTSTAQLTFAQHYCGGKVMDAAMMVGEQKLSCAPASDEGCEDEPEIADCCTNVYHQVETDTDYSGSQFDFSFQSVFLSLPVSIFSIEPPVLYFQNSVSYSAYLPPPLIKDLSVLYETFII